jgi:hypothetical protein
LCDRQAQTETVAPLRVSFIHFVQEDLENAFFFISTEFMIVLQHGLCACMRELCVCVCIDNSVSRVI